MLYQECVFVMRTDVRKCKCRLVWHDIISTVGEMTCIMNNIITDKPHNLKCNVSIINAIIFLKSFTIITFLFGFYTLRILVLLLCSPHLYI